MADKKKLVSEITSMDVDFVVVMSPRKIVAARDPQGIRPLCLGVVA